MDYQEAIKVIKNHYPTENYTRLREALDLAIKVLEEKTSELKDSLEAQKNYDEEGIFKSKTFGICPNCNSMVDFDKEEIFEPEWIHKLTCLECKYKFEIKIDGNSRL
jgi:hypothetical protein